MSISLREATPDDGAIVHWLIGELAEKLDDVEKLQSQPDDFTKALNQSPPAFRAIIAEQDETPVGICIFFSSFSSWRGTPGVYVQDLYVSRHVRGTGLGQMLLKHVAGLAREWNSAYMRLAVDSGNIEAQKFYKKMGMRWADSDRIFVIDGEDFGALST